MNETNTKGLHTPGPWAVDYSGPARLAITAQGEAIALGNLQCEDGGKDEANMQLMSAAPELLAALESLAIWRDGEPCYCHVHGDGEPTNRWLVPPHKHDDYCVAARAAIAKARGAV